MKKIRYLIGTLTLLFSMILLFFNATSQLSGVWKDNNGACYKIREVNNRVFWSMDESPRVLNVFTGLRVGNIINGRWADVPGGDLMGNGSLSIRVESNDRMVKIDQTGNYGGTAWDRSNDNECIKSGQNPTYPGGSGSMTGIWGWTADCCAGGAASSDLEITSQNSDGTFSGKFLGTEHVGTIEGRVCGDLIFFVRVVSSTTSQNWNGTITEFSGAVAKKIEGSLFSTQHAPCSFSMTKK